MWYNKGELNSVAPAMLVTSRGRINLNWRLIMNTVPHSAPSGNPRTYTVYALVDPRHNSARYIGMSVNIHARFAQHLACRGDNRYKDEWIRELLTEKQFPVLQEIERFDDIDTARERERYWIRYCLDHGVDLLNLVLKMTPEELQEEHRERAIKYAHISGLLARGIYVKWCGGNYAGRLLDQYGGDGLALTDLRHYFFITPEGARVSLYESPHLQFDTFIRQYVEVETYGLDEWHGEERYLVINFARSHGKEPAIIFDPQPNFIKKRSKKVK
jgi:predicted GIY-YIG superfamily endonuclease